MKIALQHGEPAPLQLDRFLAKTGWAHVPSGTCGEGVRCMAAYDDDELVALGGVGAAGGKPGELIFAVAPGYELRGIRDHMRKLLIPG